MKKLDVVTHTGNRALERPKWENLEFKASLGYQGIFFKNKQRNKHTYDMIFND
jgi:hypothetical protein